MWEKLLVCCLSCLCVCVRVCLCGDGMGLFGGRVGGDAGECFRVGWGLGLCLLLKIPWI